MTIIQHAQPKAHHDRPTTLWQADLPCNDDTMSVIVPFLEEFKENTTKHILLQADTNVFMPARGDIEGDNPELAMRITVQGAYFGTKGRDEDLSKVRQRFDRVIRENHSYRLLDDDFHLAYLVHPAMEDKA